MTVADVLMTTVNLKRNPRLKFDLARQVRVFNSFIEFVELEVRGTQVGRRTVPIPPYLLAVVDENTKKHLQASFRLVPPDDELSGGDWTKTKGPHEPVPTCSARIRHHRAETRQGEAVVGVERLQACIEHFRKAVEEGIQQRIDKTIADLTTSLLPALKTRPPAEWTLSTGEPLNEQEIEFKLKRELHAAFGNAKGIVEQMRLHCVFKGVTYELLKDKRFVEAATRAVPELGALYEEFQAAEATSARH